MRQPLVSPPKLKRGLAMAHDVVAAAFSLWIALSLRYGMEGMPPPQNVALILCIFAAVAAISFWFFRLGRGIWRFASLSDLRNIVLASTATVLAFLILMFLVNRLAAIPRSVPLIAWFVLIVMLSAPRLAYRLWRDGGLDTLRNFRTAPSRRKRLLIIGSAGEADRIIRRFALERSAFYSLVGVVDYRENSKGRSVRGVEMLGGIGRIEEILDELDRRELTPDALVLAAPREHRQELQEAAMIAANRKIAVTRVSDSSDVMSRREPELQPITLDSLLGRPPVRLQLDRIGEFLAGSVVLVTGAGGSIGSEVVRQVAGYGPRRLILLDISELNLYTINRRVEAVAPEIERVPVLASVRRRASIERLMQRERPDVIFHAAALKHVPLAEENTSEAVLTNVLGTRYVADAAVAAGVKAMVMISTDKAIRPTSVMGATKRVAEAYCQALDVAGTETRFITVRFGNVLGSTGSVVPLFEEQIREGGPVTVTHPDMRRYFMTVREATELVLQAAVHGLSHPDERGRILVLDMGEPVRIIDLARMMIALSGHKPDEEIPIKITGLRRGEKLFEELFDPQESPTATSTEGIFLASPRLFAQATLHSAFQRLEAAAMRDDVAEARAILTSLVPEFAGEAALVSEQTHVAHSDSAVQPAQRPSERLHGVTEPSAA